MTCDNLLTTSSNKWPQTALFEIASNGVPLSKLVIGKPATTSDANSGHMPSFTLASCLTQAKNKGWGKSPCVYDISMLLMTPFLLDGGTTVWKVSQKGSQ